MHKLIAAAVIVVLSFSTFPSDAADKPFWKDELELISSKFEADIKSKGVAPTRAISDLHKDVNDAIARRNFSVAERVLTQIVVQTPFDAKSWWKLALVILQITPDDKLEWVASAAVICPL